MPGDFFAHFAELNANSLFNQQKTMKTDTVAVRQKISEPFTTVFPANTILDKGFTSQPLTVMLPP